MQRQLVYFSQLTKKYFIGNCYRYVIENSQDEEYAVVLMLGGVFDCNISVFEEQTK